MRIRNAQPDELDRLASLWHSGWQDAHARILPAELARHRTLRSFRQRLEERIADVRVAGEPDAPSGFAMLAPDELYQLYVDPGARGSGVAARLIADAESQLARRGTRTAWLACAIGNDRAAHFYEKHGGQRVGTMVSRLPTPDGEFPLEVWRYEKALVR